MEYGARSEPALFCGFFSRMPFRRFLHIDSKISSVMKKSMTYVHDELFSGLKHTNLAETFYFYFYWLFNFVYLVLVSKSLLIHILNPKLKSLGQWSCTHMHSYNPCHEIAHMIL